MIYSGGVISTCCIVNLDAYCNNNYLWKIRNEMGWDIYTSIQYIQIFSTPTRSNTHAHINSTQWQCKRKITVLTFEKMSSIWWEEFKNVLTETFFCFNGIYIYLYISSLFSLINQSFTKLIKYKNIFEAVFECWKYLNNFFLY